MTSADITFIVGLTGVGKSTTLGALRRSTLTLLPNRRELADTIIIPEMQRDLGEPERAVTDRLGRFELTKRYRQQHPGGVVHALGRYLEQTPARGPLLFDNVRGVDEVKSAAEIFPTSRFIFLDAPNIVRLRRLVGRSDSFDSVSTGVAATRLENTSFAEKLLSIRGVDEVFDLYEVGRLEANSGVDDKALLDAVQIIVAEQQNYKSEDALAYLRTSLDDARLLYLDTSTLSVREVAAKIEAWL